MARKGTSEQQPQFGMEKVIEIGAHAKKIAQSMGLIEGFLAIADRLGEPVLTQALQIEQRPLYREMALGKLITVHKTRRSISLQLERMKQKQQQITDFGEVLGVIVPGGVAIFRDPDYTSASYVGAIAFSGGDALAQDQEICRLAVEKAGFFTDLPSKQEKTA